MYINPYYMMALQQVRAQQAQPVELTGADNAQEDWLTTLERARQAQGGGAPRQRSPVMQMAAKSEPVEEYIPTSGVEMEADARSSIDDFMGKLQSLSQERRQQDRNQQWMSFFGKLASSNNPRLLGGLGEAAGALSETTGKQASTNTVLDQASLAEQIKIAQWKQEQAMKADENASEAELRAAQAKYYNSGGSGAAGAGMGGATGVLAQRYMDAMAANGAPVTFPEALYAVQTGFRQGTSMRDGQIAPLAGAPEAKGIIKEGEVAGEIRAKGEITPKEQKEMGKKQVSTAVSDLKTQYEELDKLGGIVNPDKGAAKNISASAKSSMPGQFFQQQIGTKEQSLRNNIKSMEPVIINSIRQATGMSAKAMDSNAELLFYRAAVKAGDIRAQMAALDRIDELYGLGKKESSTPEGAKSDPLGLR